ncbi:MAG: LysM peptidoglycan-binding domain-containing protein [Bacteroides sp.]|nr:LysM peptidoglycan-binding domain-containing protein [Bacteroides sp.]
MTKIRKICAALALSLASVAVADDLNLPVKVIDGRAVYYYEVPSKETVYSITRKFGVSREELLRLNPQLIDGLRAGSTLIIKVVDSQAAEDADPVAEPVEPVEEVEEVEEVEVEEIPADTVGPQRQIQPPMPAPAEIVIADTVAVVEADAESVNVAVMLPFMLESEAITRNAQNQLNFYRGMLLALDAPGSSDVKVNLYAYDTEGSDDAVRRIVASPDMQNLDFIIAPGDSLAIESIAALADTTGASVLNLFAVKNDAHQRHQSVIQTNIPHAEMYDEATRGFIDRFKGSKVLVLNATDIPADKQSFVSQLTTELVRAGIPFEKIDYAGKLTAEELLSLPVRDYVVVPTSATREALLKVLPALNEFHQANPEMALRIFGYPEWVVLRGDIKDNLHKLNAVVYSRFSTDLDGADVVAVNDAYRRWFGCEPSPSFPDTMLLGFDSMAWILNVVANGLQTPYRGLQNSFGITEIPDGGGVNKALYFITFDPAGTVTAETL